MEDYDLFPGLGESLGKPKPASLAKPDDDALVGEIVADAPAPKRRVKRVPHEELLALQDELWEESMVVARDTLRFREIDPSDPNPPKSWIEEYGHDEAVRMFRVAQAAWLDNSKAPMGLRHAGLVAMGIAKARAVEKSAPKTLNVAVYMGEIDAPHPPMPELDVTND